jgi:hypothetical protein
MKILGSLYLLFSITIPKTGSEEVKCSPLQNFKLVMVYISIGNIFGLF